jgi:hypothetical protein
MKSLRPGFPRLSQTIANALFQARRHSNFTHGSLEARAHIPALLRFPRTCRAPLEMFHELEATLSEEFVVDVRV